MLPGGFQFGVGSGEALNEHITGARWPTADVRLDMLEEAIEVIRALWTGESVHHHGEHYTVEDARIYTLPSTAPPIYVSGFGPKAVDLAARIGDGFVCTKPDADLVTRFRENGGGDKTAQAGFKVCWSRDRENAIDTAFRLWRNAGVPGELSQVLPSPQHFEQAAQLVTRQMTAESTAFGDDPDEHVRAFAPFHRCRVRRDLRVADGCASAGHQRGGVLRVLRRQGAAATPRCPLPDLHRHGRGQGPLAEPSSSVIFPSCEDVFEPVEGALVEKGSVAHFAVVSGALAAQELQQRGGGGHLLEHFGCAG